MNRKTYFIADISANHDGDFKRAKKLGNDVNFFVIVKL